MREISKRMHESHLHGVLTMSTTSMTRTNKPSALGAVEAGAPTAVWSGYVNHLSQAN